MTYQQEQQVRTGAPGMAVSGFIVSLVGFVLALVPLLNLLAPVLGIIGIVLSGIGLSQARRHGLPRGLAIAGIILGILVIVTGVGLLVACGSALSES